MAPFVGLTGGLGAGKSEALRLLGELGAATLSTDAVVHELLSSADVQDSLAHRFGADVASDRAKIAERVFGDEEARGWLEGLLWPLVGERVAAWRASVPADQIAVVAERAKRQLSQQEKADRADFTVRNDGSLEELKQMLSRVIAKLEPT